MTYLLLSMMLAILLCACIGIGAWTSSFAQGDKSRMPTYKIFGGLSYTLLGFSGLVVKNMFEGPQATYLPILSVAFIVLGVWMLRSGIKARRAQ